MLGYIREAKTPKEGWENLKKIFVANTTAQKLQLRQELNNVQQKDVFITSYTLMNGDSLGSINVNVDEDEMKKICLDDLAPQFNTESVMIEIRDKEDIWIQNNKDLLIMNDHTT